MILLCVIHLFLLYLQVDIDVPVLFYPKADTIMNKMKLLLSKWDDFLREWLSEYMPSSGQNRRKGREDWNRQISLVHSKLLDLFVFFSAILFSVAFDLMHWEIFFFRWKVNSYSKFCTSFISKYDSFTRISIERNHCKQERINSLIRNPSWVWQAYVLSAQACILVGVLVDRRRPVI